MKVVLLAGGLGTRLSEETVLKPKPMVEIGDKPILWHIMNIYSFYGFNEFIICLGYKGYMIKEYFNNYSLHQSDITIDLKDNSKKIHQSKHKDWKISLIDTGQNTMTGGRIKRIKDYINGDTFMMTYGDGLSNVNIKKLVEYHKSHNKTATITAVQPPGRFGVLDINKDNKVTSFKEKPKDGNTWINGGFFVLDKQVFDYIEGDNISFEKEPLNRLAEDNNLLAFKHTGFWKPMDTLRDKNELENQWSSGTAKWKIWD